MSYSVTIVWGTQIQATVRHTVRPSQDDVGSMVGFCGYLHVLLINFVDYVRATKKTPCLLCYVNRGALD